MSKDEIYKRLTMAQKNKKELKKIKLQLLKEIEQLKLMLRALEAMLSVDEFRGYLRGNVFKYQWRFRDKNGLEDLRKARWYLDRLIKLENF